MGIKRFLINIMTLSPIFLGGQVWANTETLDELDSYLNTKTGSNTYFTAYDQPNAKVWQEFLENYAKTKNYKTTKEIKDQMQTPDIYNYSQYLDEGHSSLFKALDSHFCPLPIETSEWETEIQELVSEISPYYDEESEIESFTQSITDTVVSMAADNTKDAVITVPFVQWDTDKSAHLQQQQLANRWNAFGQKRQDLEVSAIKEDIEKSMIMTEQEYLATYQGQADITDKLLMDMYQKQETVIDLLAKLMLIKKQLAAMPDLTTNLTPSSGSIQDMLVAKNKISDLWEQLWHLRRQLEELNLQFTGRIYGIDEAVKEPLLYRYDTTQKNKHKVKSQL